MTLLLPALAVAFAAFCVWLVVRVINRKERWAKWTLAVVVGLPVLYMASFGPACRFNPDSVRMGIYRPFAFLAVDAPAPIRTSVRWWIELCGGEAALISVDVDAQKRAMMDYLERIKANGLDEDEIE